MYWPPYTNFWLCALSIDPSSARSMRKALFTKPSPFSLIFVCIWIWICSPCATIRFPPAELLTSKCAFIMKKKQSHLIAHKQ